MRDMSHNPTPEVGTIIVQVFALRQKLLDFEHQLPSNLKFVNRNLYLHANSAQRMTFIMLRSWWHECNTIIHRFTLPGFRESVDLTAQNANFVNQCQQQVLQSALAQSNFWRLIVHMKYSLLFDPTMVVLVHSNTRTLLAYRKLKDPLVSEEINHPGETHDIETLLCSNVSFLDELSKRIPKVTFGVSSQLHIIRPQQTQFNHFARFKLLFKQSSSVYINLLMKVEPNSNGKFEILCKKTAFRLPLRQLYARDCLLNDAILARILLKKENENKNDQRNPRNLRKMYYMEVSSSL